MSLPLQYRSMTNLHVTNPDSGRRSRSPHGRTSIACPPLLLAVIACGATPSAESPSRSQATSKGEAFARSPPAITTYARKVGPSSQDPPATVVSSVPPSDLDISLPTGERAELPRPQVRLPKISETAIGYQSPQEQTRNGSVSRARWTPQCKGKPLHHCPSGLDPNCAPTILDGREYRLAVLTTSPNFTVSRDSHVVYRGSLPSHWASAPIYTLVVWQGSWLVEVNDDIIMDGRSFNQQMGYSRTFNWVLFREQPFYFFEQKQVIRISYAGVTLPVAYDEVAHNLCCSEALHDVVNCSDEISFYAKRGPKWFHVALSI